MKVFVSSHICGSHICTHIAVSDPKNHVISLKITFFAFLATFRKFFFYPPPNRASDLFFWTFSKIDQTKSFQWSIMFSKVNLRLLNTFFDIIFAFHGLFDSLRHEKVMRTAKIAIFWPFCPIGAIQGKIAIFAVLVTFLCRRESKSA